MTRPRLIATDLDGTLLGPDGQVCDSDADALLAAHARGIHIVVATGRPARWLDCLEPIRGAHPHVIVSNGAAVVDLASGAMEQVREIGADDLVAVTGALRTRFPGVFFAVEHGYLFGCEPAWPIRESDPAGQVMHATRNVVVAPWETLVSSDAPVVKLLAMVEGVSVDAFHAQASELLGDRVTVTHSTPPGNRALLEMSAAGVSKASMLATFCSDHGVPPSAVVAFGDMPNDFGMLTFAGRGYAMRNAHASLRTTFSTAPSNHDGGVGAVVRRLLAD